MITFRIRLMALAFAVVVGSTVAFAADPADRHPDLHLIPWPKSLQARAGYLALSTESRIIAADDQLRDVVARRRLHDGCAGFDHRSVGEHNCESYDLFASDAVTNRSHVSGIGVVVAT